MMKVKDYITSVVEHIQNLPVDQIGAVIDTLHQARLDGKQIFIMGNGGSASTASHFVCDIAKNTRKAGWPHFKAIGLTDNMAIFSAYANDEGYESVFAQQLDNLVQPGDIVIGISASGNSPNVLNAMEVAAQHQAHRIGFTGFKGGRLGSMVDQHINIPSDNYGQVEDIHLMLEHMMIEALKERVATELSRDQFGEQRVSSIFAYAEQSISQLFGKPTVVATQEVDAQSVESQDWLQNINENMTDNDLHAVIERILLLVLQKLGAASGSILVLDDDGQVMTGAIAHDGEVQGQTTQELNDIIQQGLAGWVVKNREAALISSTSEDPRWLARNWEEGKSRSALSVPLISQDRVVGVITTVQDGGQFTCEDLDVLMAIACGFSIG